MKLKDQLGCFSFGLIIAPTKMESSFNYWKASTLGPHWDHLVLAKQVFKLSSGERHSAETEQHCETKIHSKAARETKSDYLKYILTIQITHATPILRQ
jgi:hypothetical protein